MKRDFNVVKGEQGYQAGDEHAVSQATAIAQLADAPTIEKLIQALAMLDLFGGQLYVQAIRAKFDQDGMVIPDAEAREQTGRWETVGYAFRFDTVDIATMARAGNEFVVGSQIEPDEHDNKELARKEAMGQPLTAAPPESEFEDELPPVASPEAVAAEMPG
jgi:hypothetical protein